MFERRVMKMFYRKARAPADLVWHSDVPPKLLVEAVARREHPGKALDIGCGAGVHAVYLAKRGYEVTGLDYIPKALELAQGVAAAEGVSARWVEANLLDWEPSARFDLILDSGCLHNFGSRDLDKYRAKLLSWLAPGSDFILAHWGKRHPLDWRPIGPRRRTRQELVRLFAPELREKVYECEVMSGVPLPIGPTVLGHCFWFETLG